MKLLDTDALRVEALRRLKGEVEGDGQRRRVAVSAAGLPRAAAAALAAAAATLCDGCREGGGCRRRHALAAPCTYRPSPCPLPPPPPPPQAASDKRKEGQASALAEFCRDLCKEAEAQRTDPVGWVAALLGGRAAGRLGCMAGGPVALRLGPQVPCPNCALPAPLPASARQVIGRAAEVVRITQILGRKKKVGWWRAGAWAGGRPPARRARARSGLRHAVAACSPSPSPSSTHPAPPPPAAQNNPILLGEPGVGKTAIAEGLARAIVTRTNADGSPLPAFLRGKRVMQLDVGLLIAGAKVRPVARGSGAFAVAGRRLGRGAGWAAPGARPPRGPAPTPRPSKMRASRPPRPQERGELELRVTRLLQECKSEGNVILMIDEVSAGGGGAGLWCAGSAGLG